MTSTLPTFGPSFVKQKFLITDTIDKIRNIHQDTITMLKNVGVNTIGQLLTTIGNGTINRVPYLGRKKRSALINALDLYAKELEYTLIKNKKGAQYCKEKQIYASDVVSRYIAQNEEFERGAQICVK